MKFLRYYRGRGFPKYLPVVYPGGWVVYIGNHQLSSEEFIESGVFLHQWAQTILTYFDRQVVSRGRKYGGHSGGRHRSRNFGRETGEARLG